MSIALMTQHADDKTHFWTTDGKLDSFLSLHRKHRLPFAGFGVIISFIPSDAHLRALIVRRSTCGCTILAIRKGSRELFRHLDFD
jgi:hypothetical protein